MKVEPSFWHDYGDLVWSDNKFNWRNFTIIQLHFEYAHYSGVFEIFIALMGLHCNIDIFKSK